MNAAIVGYGRMGREVEAALKKRGHDIVVRIDPVDQMADSSTVDSKSLDGVDVAIEFSSASAVPANAAAYAGSGVSAVVGTTGWDKEISSVRSAVSDAAIGYVRGSNFSIGAHLFFTFAAHAAKLLNAVPDYDVFAYEIHHNKKGDSPSGTALTLAEAIIHNLKRKTRIQTEAVHGTIAPDELHVASVRGGAEPGTHTMVIDSAADTIEIRHRARNRSGFALGAVMAAEWVQGKQGFFSVEDFIRDILARGE